MSSAVAGTTLARARLERHLADIPHRLRASVPRHDLGERRTEGERGGPGIVPHVHRRGAGMIGLAAKREPERLDADDGADDADLPAGMFEPRALLDMRLEISDVTARDRAAPACWRESQLGDDAGSERSPSLLLAAATSAATSSPQNVREPSKPRKVPSSSWNEMASTPMGARRSPPRSARSRAHRSRRGCRRASRRTAPCRCASRSGSPGLRGPCGHKHCRPRR